MEKNRPLCKRDLKGYFDNHQKVPLLLTPSNFIKSYDTASEEAL